MRGAYTESDNTPARKQRSGHARLVIPYIANRLRLEKFGSFLGLID